MESMREWKGDVQHIFRGVNIEFEVEDFVDIQRPQTDVLMIKAGTGGYNVKRIFVDNRSSIDVTFMDYFRRMRFKSTVESVETSLFGFTGEAIRVTRRVELQMTLGEDFYRQP